MSANTERIRAAYGPNNMHCLDKLEPGKKCIQTVKVWDGWNSLDDGNKDSGSPEAIVPADLNQERGRGIAEEALKIINGERQNVYGDPEDNFAVIARLWTAYLSTEDGSVTRDIRIEPADVAYMMVLLKLAREITGRKKDNAVDLLGYAMLAADMRYRGCK